MSNWDKSSFIENMRENCSREIAKIGEAIIQFSETHASDISWGRGTDHGTMTFRCDSDDGNLSSGGQLYIYYTDDGSGFDGAGTVSSQWVSATPIASTMSAQISALQAQVNSLLSRVAALES